MRKLLPVVLLVSLTGCGTIQHENMVRNQTAQEDIRERNKTARAKQASSDTVRLAAVQGASTVTVRRPEANPPPSCPDLEKQEAEFKALCTDHTEGSGDINEDREAVCDPLRAALNQLRESCPDGASEKETEVVFAQPDPISAGISINLTGASTGDIRFIIQSPGAADQSANGVQDTPTPAPPSSVITGLSTGLLDLLGKAAPWAIGGYALGEFADAFGDGMRNAGDRDHSVDESVTIDQSIGGDKISLPAEE